MKLRRKTRIIRETREVTIIRLRRGESGQIFCAVCGLAAAHLSVAEAAAFLDVSEKSIFRLSEAGRIHTAETATGSMLVCGLSLSGAAINLEGDLP